MASVKRYDLETDRHGWSTMKENEYGEYVLASDYDRMENQVTELRACVRELVDHVGICGSGKCEVCNKVSTLIGEGGEESK